MRDAIQSIYHVSIEFYNIKSLFLIILVKVQLLGKSTTFAAIFYILNCINIHVGRVTCSLKGMLVE